MATSAVPAAASDSPTSDEEADSPADSSKARRTRGPNRRMPVPAFLLTDDVLLDVREVAGARRCGVSTVWRDVAAGTFPKPLYVNPKSPRWRLSAVRAAMGLEG